MEGPDEVDKKIVEMLNEDFTKSFSEIAKELGLTRQAISQRIKRLKEEGVIKWRFELRSKLEG